MTAATMVRKVLFWCHLSAGLAAGILIGIMSFTGAALTFEKDLVAWAERDARRIESPGADTARLPLGEVLARVRTAQPAVRIANVAVSADQREAVAVGTTDNRTFCVNPWSGDVREAQAPRMRSFMQTMRGWHTRLAIAGSPGHPSVGAQLNSAANVVFVFLGVSGLVLWWPRAWRWAVLRSSLWLASDARGRARDWNWHNAAGFWSLPLLLLLAGTGVVLSYRWAGDLVLRLAGEKPPAPVSASASAPATPGAAVPPGAPAPPPIPAGPAGLTPDALFSAAQKPIPDWQLITLRFNPPLSAAPASQPPPKTFTVVIKERQPWPPFSVNTLTLDAVSGDEKRRDNYAALSKGNRARRWIRVLHSGEALGSFVQFLSGLACLGGCLLVYTGFALSWRRFFGRKAAAVPAGG